MNTENFEIRATPIGTKLTYREEIRDGSSIIVTSEPTAESGRELSVTFGSQYPADRFGSLDVPEWEHVKERVDTLLGIVDNVARQVDSASYDDVEGYRDIEDRVQEVIEAELSHLSE